MSSLEIIRVARALVVLRGQRVILDRDLAVLYGVSTARLNEAVKRNSKRFPPDFMFRITTDEHESLMSQIATSKMGRGGQRKLSWAFTEHGAIQAANVLNSPRAVAMGVHVVRAFIRLRELVASSAELVERLDKLERKHRDHDKAIAVLLSAIRQLTAASPSSGRGIGFTADLE